MLTYDDAAQMSGSKHLVSFAGGRSRYLTVERVDGHPDIVGTLYGNEIARWLPDRVIVRTSGHNTPSTVEALNAVAGQSFYNSGGQLHYRGQLMREGLTLDYEGNVLDAGDELSPMRDVAMATRVDDRVTVTTTGRAGNMVALTAAIRLLDGRRGELLNPSPDNPRRGSGTFAYDVWTLSPGTEGPVCETCGTLQSDDHSVMFRDGAGVLCDGCAE